MSQNQEIIEAKLCAYIDDELDAAGRAELEKHLAANPQHQRLIEELRRTSGLVRNLPHESAPPELAEGFNAHLERSVLLEGVSEDVAAADLKAPRWPQLVAMAAITLLTIGLGIVVYFALPGTGARPQIVQIAPHPNAVQLNSTDDDQSSDAMMRDVDKSVKKDENGALASLDTPAGAAGVANAARALSADHLIPSVAATQPSADSNALRFGASGSSPVVLVMHSNNPSEARRSLVIYLVQQNIAWEPAQAPPVTDALSLRDAGELQNKAGGDAGGRQTAGAGETAATQPAPNAVEELAKAAVPTTGPSGSIGGGASNLLAAKSAMPASAATQPMADEAKRLRSSDGEATDTGGVPSIAQPDFSISCKMTAEQANALRASLEQPGTFIDPLPAEVDRKTIADATEKQAAQTPPPAVPDFSLAPAASAPPTTNLLPSAAPAAASPAPGSAADQSAKFDVSATQPAEVQSENLTSASATQPSNNPAAVLDVVIVVRPTDQPTIQPPAAAAPDAPTTAPALIAPGTQP